MLVVIADTVATELGASGSSMAGWHLWLSWEVVVGVGETMGGGCRRVGLVSRFFCLAWGWLSPHDVIARCKRIGFLQRAWPRKTTFFP